MGEPIIYDHPMDMGAALSVTDADYTNAHDRDVAESAGGGGDALIGQQNYTSSYFYIWRLGIWFQPCSLPEGAELVSVRLKVKMKKYTLLLTPFFDWYIQLRSTPSLEDGSLEESKADYPRMLLGTLITTKYADDVSDTLAYHYFDIPTFHIDLTQVTILSLISSRDKSATEPDAETSEAVEAKCTPTTCFLELTYLLAVEATTQLADDITKTSAWLHGTLVEDGGAPCECGFEWGLAEDALNEKTSESWKSKGQSFSEDIPAAGEEVLPETTYYFRAFAIHPTLGTVYGEILNFTTLGGIVYPSEPTIRVTGLIHRWFPGNYTLEIALGAITTEFGLPTWTKKPARPIPPDEPSPPLVECVEGAYKVEGEVVYKCIGGTWVSQGRF